MCCFFWFHFKLLGTHRINLFQGDFSNVLLDAVILAHVGMAATQNMARMNIDTIHKYLTQTMVYVVNTFLSNQFVQVLYKKIIIKKKKVLSEKRVCSGAKIEYREHAGRLKVKRTEDEKTAISKQRALP